MVSAAVPVAVCVHQKMSAIIQFEEAVERLRQEVAVAADPQLAPHSKAAAIVHWGATLTDLRMQNYQKHAMTLAKRLWIGLIDRRSRIGGMPDLVGDTDVLEMGSRELALKALEKNLTSRLVGLARQKKTLKKRYYARETAIANREAAGTMQYNNKQSAGQNRLAHQALAAFIHNLSTGTRAAPQGQNLRKLQDLLVKDTDRIVADCRYMISKDIDPDRMTIGESRVKRLEDDLTRILKLQKEVELTRYQVSQEPLPLLRPILVKKNPSKGRNNNP